MSKEKILFVNYDMSIGGNVTSLVSFLSCIDLERYEVDLLLYKNVGDFLTLIPDGINLLPQGFKYDGKIGSLKKYFKALFSGYLVKAFFTNRKIGQKGLSYQVMAECQARLFSRKLDKEYDYAVGFFEGWSDRYIADIVRAKHKYGWYHNMFSEICPVAELELPWLEKVEKVANVSVQAHEHFCESLPSMINKACYYKNILSSAFVRKRAADEDPSDKLYQKFVASDCFKIVTVCRLEMKQKALERAVFAVKRLLSDGYKFVWYIIGEGPDAEYLADLIKEHGVEESLVLVGKRVNPCPFVKSSDVFCLTSRYEGKPMAITETMMLGTPPIVTEYASAHDQISHGVDGRIAPNNDEDIFDELKFCLDNPGEVEKMREYLLSHEYGNEDYADFLQSELFCKH